MNKSFSQIKYELENIWLCDSLKGRVKYFYTRYRKAHDQRGRIAIRVDGEEVFKSSDLAFNMLEYSIEYGKDKDYMDASYKIAEDGEIHIGYFYNSYQVYINSSISESLKGENPNIRLFAILDKRVGKRTLLKLVDKMKSEPEWLAYFYKLRFDSQNIKYN